MSKPIISFIVPSRGAGIYLEYTIKNLLDTSDTRYEVVLNFNNGFSPIPRSILDIADSRLRIFRTTDNLSMAKNWYEALCNAKGEWVCYIGSDDGIVSKNLSKFINELNKQTKISVVINHTLSFTYPRSKVISWKTLPVTKCTEKQIKVNWPIKMASFFPQFNYDLPQPYSKAIVKKQILQKIITKESEIPSSQPDIFLGNYIAMQSKNGIFIDIPLTIRGSSEVSNGIQIHSGITKTQSSKEWQSNFYANEKYLQFKFGPTCRPAVARDSYLDAKAYIKGVSRKHSIFSEFWCNLSCRDKSHHKAIWRYLHHITSSIYYLGLILRKLWSVKNFQYKIPKDKRVNLFSKNNIYDISKSFTNQ